MMTCAAAMVLAPPLPPFRPPYLLWPPVFFVSSCFAKNSVVILRQENSGIFLLVRGGRVVSRRLRVARRRLPCRRGHLERFVALAAPAAAATTFLPSHPLDPGGQRTVDGRSKKSWCGRTRLLSPPTENFRGRADTRLGMTMRSGWRWPAGRVCF